MSMTYYFVYNLVYSCLSADSLDGLHTIHVLISMLIRLQSATLITKANQAKAVSCCYVIIMFYLTNLNDFIFSNHSVIKDVLHNGD